MIFPTASWVSATLSSRRFHHSEMEGGINLGFCAIARGELYCWGRNKKNEYVAPTKQIIPNLPTPIRLFANNATAYCAVTQGSDQVWCWGKGTLGELGNGKFEESSSAVRVLDWAE